MLSILIQNVLPILLKLALTGLALGSTALLGLIAKHVRSQLASHALQELTVIAHNVVASTAQTVVDDAKREDKFSAQTAKDARDTAIAALKSAGAPFLANIGSLLDPAALDAYLAHLVESAVAAQKASPVGVLNLSDFGAGTVH